jgi:hypothetical protein
MSDGSQSASRPLRKEERELLQSLLAATYTPKEIEQRLSHASVQQMEDGGMGSIRFVEPASAKQSFGQEIAAAGYVDSDGVPVDITVNLDKKGNLFEIDFWKVDFSSLLRYPRSQDLKMRDVAGTKSPETAIAS